MVIFFHFWVLISQNNVDFTLHTLLNFGKIINIWTHRRVKWIIWFSTKSNLSIINYQLIFSIIFNTINVYINIYLYYKCSHFIIIYQLPTKCLIAGVHLCKSSFWFTFQSYLRNQDVYKMNNWTATLTLFLSILSGSFQWRRNLHSGRTITSFFWVAGRCWYLVRTL